jgi:hypothetical protein
MIIDGKFYPTTKEEWLSIPIVKGAYDSGLIDFQEMTSFTGQIFKIEKYLR